MTKGDVTLTKAFSLLVLLTRLPEYFLRSQSKIQRLQILYNLSNGLFRLRMFRSVLWTVGNMVRDAGLSLDRVGMAIQGRQAFRESRMCSSVSLDTDH